MNQDFLKSNKVSPRSVVAKRTAFKSLWLKHFVESEAGVVLDPNTTDKSLLILGSATKVFIKQLVREARKYADREAGISRVDDNVNMTILEPRHYLEAYRLMERKKFASNISSIQPNVNYDDSESDSEAEPPRSKRIRVQ
eukprot:GDKJ01025839.1.p1 GENE.GDKJ01025839.1~~GDKJ01025839.1.p1  ORF type:complete len:148 (+),score=22.87 GDKJ01025839.1:27-446(+)